MMSPRDDVVRFQSKFRLRRAATLGAIGALIAMFVAIKSHVISSDWLPVALVAMAGVAGGVWCCPRCGERLGVALTVHQCPHCYLDLVRRPSA
jgi:integral membrane sensor domain MASE1